MKDCQSRTIRKSNIIPLQQLIQYILQFKADEAIASLLKEKVTPDNLLRLKNYVTSYLVRVYNINELEDSLLQTNLQPQGFKDYLDTVYSNTDDGIQNFYEDHNVSQKDIKKIVAEDLILEELIMINPLYALMQMQNNEILSSVTIH